MSNDLFCAAVTQFAKENRQHFVMFTKRDDGNTRLTHCLNDAGTVIAFLEDVLTEMKRTKNSNRAGL